MEKLLIVNWQNTLSRGYVPMGLVQELSTKIWLTKEAYEAFSKMNKGIQAEGFSGFILVSGYRSYGHQQEVFDRKVNHLIQDGLTKEEATNKAMTIVAIPGTSEHQTGLAIDLTDPKLSKEKDPLVEEFAQTDHGKWLNLNAHKYGFILRYPKDKVNITHITYEPWHYRYVGTQHAVAIKTLDMCLEEYIYYLNKNEF